MKTILMVLLGTILCILLIGIIIILLSLTSAICAKTLRNIANWLEGDNKDEK